MFKWTDERRLYSLKNEKIFKNFFLKKRYVTTNPCQLRSLASSRPPCPCWDTRFAQHYPALNAGTLEGRAPVWLPDAVPAESMLAVRFAPSSAT